MTDRVEANRIVLAIVGAFLALLCPTLRAQVPHLINYQGRVVVGTTNFNGTGSFKFALINNADGSTLWSNDGTSTNGSEPASAVMLAVDKGLYSVLLGDTSVSNMTAVSNTVFSNSDVRLRVWFDDGTHGSQLLLPDQRIAAVGYAIMADTVPDGSISSEKLAAGAVGSSQLADGAVGMAQLADGAVGEGQLAPGAVGATQLADGAVGTAQLATGAVGGTQIAPGAVGSTQLAAGAVGTAQLAAGAVGQAQLAPGAVGATQLANGAVGTSQLAVGAVGPTQLSSGAVGTAQLAPGAVGATQLAAGAVGTSQLAAGAVGGTQLAAGAVGPAQLASGAVGMTNLAAGAVGTTQLAAGSVTSAKIDTTTVQQRITGSAPAGTFVQSVNPDGTIVAAPIATGAGLTNFGGAISVDSTVPRLNSPNMFTGTNIFSTPVGIGTATPILPLEVTGTNGQSAMFSSSINSNNIIIKGSIGTTGGIGIQTDSLDPIHTATAFLSNSRAVADGFHRYDPTITGSQFVLESNFDVGGGVRQNEFYWQNEGSYRPFQSLWQPVAGIAQTAVFGGFVVTGDSLKLSSPDFALADFRQSNPAGYTVLTVFNTHAISKGAMVVIGGDASSFEQSGWNLGNDLFSNGNQNFFITNRSLNTRPFYIDASDHIGIGTINPSSKLHIVSSSEQFRSGYDANNYWTASTTSTGLTQFNAVGSGAAFNFSDNVGIGTPSPFAQLAITGVGTGDIFGIASATGTRVLTVASTGRVGIGTATPAAKLDVNGNIAVAGSPVIDANGSWVGNPTGLIGPQGPKGDIGLPGAIGLQGPQGPQGATGAIGPQGPIGFTGAKGDTGATGPQGIIGASPFSLNGTSAYYIDGNVGIGTATPGSTLEVAVGGTTLADRWRTRSSIRWKTNVHTIEHALDKVQDLRGVTYDWRDGRGKDIGLIAEEVGAIVPEVVTFEPNGIDAQSVDYSRLVAVLIEAVKEQEKEISALREEIAAGRKSETPQNTLPNK